MVTKKKKPKSRIALIKELCESRLSHRHLHGPDCGHQAVKHGDHVDYLHDGHYHRAHGKHFDECSGPKGSAV